MTVAGAYPWICGVGRLFALLPALSALPLLSVLAQTDPRLVAAIRQAQQGQSDSARIQVQTLLKATPISDTLYPQIVYTQAMISNEAGEMRRQLQRVAVEYSSSSWADDALLRLVQLDYASGNLDGAARNLERIRQDYPGSSLIPQAAYWAARTYFDQKKPDLACRWITEGMTGSGGNIELQNQLRYLNQRCSRFAAGGHPRSDTVTSAPAATDPPQIVVAPSDSARPADSTADSAFSPSAPSRPAPRQPTITSRPDSAAAAQPTTSKLRYRIQITAVRSAGTAQSIETRLKSLGYKPITVEEGGLYKVRIGDYSTKADAIAALPEVKSKLGGSPFVVAGS